MENAAKGNFAAWVLMPMLLVGCAGTTNNVQPADTGNASTSPAVMFKDPASYFSQRFDADALGSDVKDAVTRANLEPVSFNKIVVHTRDQITMSNQTTQTVYTNEITWENAGLGLVRRMQFVQLNGFEVQTRFDLMYRGYFPLLTQQVPANATSLPPVMETRKVIRFDTATDSHMNFTYLFGAFGKTTARDPAQFVCDSGKSYRASLMSPVIEGQALELDCQAVNANGVVVSKMTFAYLQKYGVALLLSTRNTAAAFDSMILDFKVQ